MPEDFNSRKRRGRVGGLKAQAWSGRRPNGIVGYSLVRRMGVTTELAVVEEAGVACGSLRRVKWEKNTGRSNSIQLHIN